MNFKKILIIVIIGFVLTAAFIGYQIFQRYNKPILNIPSGQEYFYISSGSDYQTIFEELKNKGWLLDPVLFDQISEYKNYKEKVKPGKYLLTDKMGVNELVNKLRSGNQEPIRFTFNNIRFISKLASLVGQKLEADSTEFMALMNDELFLDSLGFSSHTAIALFLPNTYEFFWNTSNREFIARMHKEYNKFWTDERKEKALAIPLSPLEVSILASIIQEETNKKDEMQLMAGVLINRLQIGMKLQADPTARFAYGDFSVKRILNDYTKIESPYNTYYVFGLPPGPICMPEAHSIDAVLNYENTDYLYYCAKTDGSGYHAFAETHSQHLKNAKAYHNYLRKLNIRR